MNIVGGLETRVNTTTVGNQDSPKVAALSNGGWVVTWHGYRDDGSDVFMQIYDAD